MDVPGYRVIRELGRGGMATVYLAVQESLQRHVALKVVNPELASDSGFRGRFLREAQLIARLVHPHIVTVYDFGSRGEVYFLSMEYLPGGTLKERIGAGLAPAQAVDILVPVAKALAHAHRQGVVHRDIKPQNILFRDDGTPVLTDFGIARLLTSDTQLTATGVTIGSPRYMSPEQVMGQAVDGRSDLFSLGIVFYELLTGTVPWVDTDHPITVALKLCSEPVPALPAGLARYQGVLDRLVAKSPADRYPDAETLAADLQRLVQAEEAAAAADATVLYVPQAAAEGSRERRAAGGRKLLLGVAGVLALAGLGTALYLVSDRPPSPREEPVGAAPPPKVEPEQPLAGRYEKLAIEHLRNGQFEQSLELIGIGLRSAPGDARLLALQDTTQRRQKAAGHLAAAQRYLEQGSLEAGTAEVEEGLALVADDASLLAMRGELQKKRQQRDQHEAAQLLTEAQARLSDDDADAALVLVGQGLALVPNHQELLVLRRQVTERIARRRQVADLLLQLRGLEHDERWDDALALIGKGLSVEPGNAELQGAQTRVTERQAAEQKRLEAERLAAEQKRLEAERLAAEQKRLEAERQAAEQKRLEAERQAAEQQRLEAERQAAEQKRLEAERVAAEQKRLEAERVAAEQRRLEAERLATEQKRLEAERQAAEQQRLEAERVAAEQKRLEADRQAAEQKRLETEARISRLLGQCEEHLRAGRLTTGAPGTAHGCYKEVLRLQPGNPVALAGVAQIADQYASLASEALDSRDLAAARANLERLRAVSPQHAQLAALQKRARQMEEQTQRKATPQARTTPTPRSTPAERPPKVAEPPRQKGTEGAAQEPVPASPPPAPKTEEAPKRPRIWGSF